MVIRWMLQDHIDDQFNIGSGNGLLPDGSKPLPKPIVAKAYDFVWRHKAIMG